MKNLIFIAVALLFLPLQAFAQTEISGVVKDGNTLLELNGVNVFIQGSNLGTVSDVGGHFRLRIPDRYRNDKIVFQHISYRSVTISVDSLQTISPVFLEPRIIQLPGLQVVGRGETYEVKIRQDIPMQVSLVDANLNNIRGYVDAGDVLKTEQSIQVYEDLSGKKTISLRGGNPDDVIVLYNGIRINNPYDNVFDFSAIDLESLERFEIIRGSNTAMYGPDAFSGVINIVPRFESNHFLRAHYRVGTYDDNTVGLHLYQGLKNFSASLSYKDNRTERLFDEAADANSSLKNNAQHFSGNLVWYAGKERQNRFSLMVLQSEQEYDNNRDDENFADKNRIAAVSYRGRRGWSKDLDLDYSMHKLDESQKYVFFQQEYDRQLNNKSHRFQVNKHLQYGNLNFLAGYQFEKSDLTLSDDRNTFTSVFMQDVVLNRKHHGVMAIAKLSGNTGSNLVQNFHIDFSTRYDNINDQAEHALNDLQNDYESTVTKFAVELQGLRPDMAFRAFLNSGSNFKVPTLSQQISNPLHDGDRAKQGLEPEKISSFEIGMDVQREIYGYNSISGWAVWASYFKNYYENKFRSYTSPGSPFIFYDNVETAELGGVEAKASAFFFGKKITAEVGLSRFSIPEKVAFPFKSELKRVLNLTVEHAGYSLMFHHFYESEQSGWIRDYSGQLTEVSLDSYANLDVHLTKSFDVWKMRWYINFSGRNLIKQKDTVLQGLAIRDRRFYVSLGGDI